MRKRRLGKDVKRGATPEFVNMSKEILYPQIQSVTYTKHSLSILRHPDSAPTQLIRCVSDLSSIRVVNSLCCHLSSSLHLCAWLCCLFESCVCCSPPLLLCFFVISICRRFDPGGSLDRRVNCRCVSQPRWVGARRNTRGSKRGNRGSCLSCAQGGCACSRGLQAFARERERGREPMRQPVLSRGHPLVRGPWTFLL
jgi:hypothetical protein